MKRGYIKLYRKSIDSTIFAHDGMWKLWTLCLMLTNHAEAEVVIPGILEPIKVNPGQFITGRDSLHYAYHQGNLKKNYSRKSAPTAITLYRWLLTLSNMQILHINSRNKYSIITILNWDQYQIGSPQTIDISKNDLSLTPKRAALANSEHQKSSVNPDESAILMDDMQKTEQQMNNRRTTDEHKQELIKNIKEIIGFLNQISSRTFQAKGQGLSFISARLSEGYTVEDCKLVCRFKWNDPKFDKQYFRPQTLFRQSNFEGYLFTARERSGQALTSGYQSEMQPQLEELLK